MKEVQLERNGPPIRTKNPNARKRCISSQNFCVSFSCFRFLLLAYRKSFEIFISRFLNRLIKIVAPELKIRCLARRWFTRIADNADCFSNAREFANHVRGVNAGPKVGNLSTVHVRVAVFSHFYRTRNV